LQNDNTIINTARLLIARLEHLSVDSHWAHRASGLRGNLLRALEQVEAGSATPEQVVLLQRLMEQGFEILIRAAREIRAPEK
jgi:hypothetical protein